MRKRLTINECTLERGIKPKVWYGIVFGHAIIFTPITGWRSPRIKSWKSNYQYFGEPAGLGPQITRQDTLKDCVFETQLHLLPDKERTK